MIQEPTMAEKEMEPGSPIDVNLDNIPHVDAQTPPDEAAPLRVIAFDTQSICAQLFGKQLSNCLRLGRIHHPYVLAATLGPERIHTDIGNEHTRRLWDERAGATSKRVQSITYEAATNELLRQADRMEKQVRTKSRLDES
jgi:hypothetical protein